MNVRVYKFSPKFLKAIESKKTESLLEETARLLNASKAEVIKRSLSQYCPSILDEKSRQPYKLIEDLLDKGGSGKRDLSVRGEEILREMFRRKE